MTDKKYWDLSSKFFMYMLKKNVPSNTWIPEKEIEGILEKLDEEYWLTFDTKLEAALHNDNHKILKPLSYSSVALSEDFVLNFLFAIVIRNKKVYDKFRDKPDMFGAAYGSPILKASLPNLKNYRKEGELFTLSEKINLSKLVEEINDSDEDHLQYPKTYKTMAIAKGRLAQRNFPKDS